MRLLAAAALAVAVPGGALGATVAETAAAATSESTVEVISPEKVGHAAALAAAAAIIRASQTSEAYERSFEEIAAASAAPLLSMNESSTTKIPLWPLGESGFYEVPVEPPAETEFPKGKWTSVIAWAMRHIESGSNVRFRPAKPEDANRVRFESGAGCLSLVGRHPDRVPQRISLHSPDCLTRHSSLHEILHTLGLPHEHQRPDAPQHVRLSELAPAAFAAQALPDNSTAAAAVAAVKPYDAASIMHYGQWMHALTAELQPIVDARAATLSSCDWAMLNTLYPPPTPAPSLRGKSLGEYKNPPLCFPHAHPRACKPLKSCPYGLLVCDYICNLDCDYGREPPDGSRALCGYVGGGDFPPLPAELRGPWRTRVDQIYREW